MSGTAQPVERLLDNALHFKEFYGGYHGTCGETMLATLMVCASMATESKDEAIALMLAMTKEMIGLGWAGASGSTTTARLRDEAHRRGYSTYENDFKAANGETHPAYISFKQPLYQQWLHEFMLAYAGILPFGLEVAEAHNLDSWNGGSDEAGVKYHFIAVLGLNEHGYICNDGDNRQIESHLVIYPWSEIWQAVPCGLLTLNMEAIAVAQLTFDKVSGFFTQKSSTEWVAKATKVSISDAALKFYQNQQAQGGLGGFTDMGLPLLAKFYIGEASFTICERGVIVYDPNRKFDSPPGAVGQCYKGHIDDPRIMGRLTPDQSAALAQAKADAAKAHTDLNTANATITDLKKQLATAQQPLTTKVALDKITADLVAAGKL